MTSNDDGRAAFIALVIVAAFAGAGGIIGLILGFVYGEAFGADEDGIGLAYGFAAALIGVPLGALVGYYVSNKNVLDQGGRPPGRQPRGRRTRFP